MNRFTPPKSARNTNALWIAMAVFVPILSFAVTALVVVPMVSADVWKIRAITVTNESVKTITDTNKEITIVNQNPDAGSSEYVKALTAYGRQNKAIKLAKSQLTSVGGMSVVDITGQYAEAVRTQQELQKTYEEMLALNTTDMERTKINLTLAKIFEGVGNNPMETPEQVRAVAANFHSASDEIRAFANTKNGTENDRKTAIECEKFAQALDALVAAEAVSDTAAIDRVYDDLDTITAALEVLDQQARDEQVEAQKNIDKNVGRMNAVIKSLE